MTDSELEGTLGSEPQGDGAAFLRRAMRAHRDSALHQTGNSPFDSPLYVVGQIAEVLGASRVFWATWAERGYVGRALVGASNAEQRSFLNRPLPALPPESAPDGERIRITSVDSLRRSHPWLAEIADADSVILAVATWMQEHPTCVIGIAGLQDLDDDRRLVIEQFLLMMMGSTMAEALMRQRNIADLRRGEALDTLVVELDGERRRISHEIHDSVLQSVSSIAHFLETLSASSESDATRAVLERLRLEAQTSAITLRRIVNDFEPEQHREESMNAQIRAMTARVTDLFGLTIVLDIDPDVDDVPLARPVLRILRQGLDNVISHANATTARVSAKVNDGIQLVLTIDDDGDGMQPESPWDLGVGVRSMTRITNELGGTLNIGPSTDEVGTRLVATFAINGRPLQQFTGTNGTNGTDGTGLDQHELGVAARQATLSLLDQGRRPTISSVAESIGVARRVLLNRYVSADALNAEATASLVDSIEERWAAFGAVDHDDPLENRIDELVKRRFTMEEWGRPIRQHTATVDPSSRFDDEVLTAFRPELSLMPVSERENTGRLVSWLLRVRTIRAIVADAAVDPDVARATISSVAATLLGGQQPRT